MPPSPAAGCSAEANLRAALTLLRSLQACGLRRLVLCPGSRSAPLAVAAGVLGQQGLDLFTAVDERSAAFLAVGLGRGDGRPTALVTTSGTAVANLLPAVVEADSGAVPLLLLTADRPARLKHCGANQTVNQEAFLAPCCRLFCEGDPAGLAAMEPSALRRMASEAWTACLGAPHGPVHCNLPIEELLHVDASALAAVGALAMAAPICPDAGALPAPAPTAAAPDPLDPDQPGVVVAGPWRGSTADLALQAEALIRWQRRSGWPVLADGLSGLRGWPGLDLIHSYDLLLAEGHALPPATQLLRLGPMPSSRRLQQWLASASGPSLLISQNDPRRLDAGVPVGARWPAGLPAWLAALPPQRLAGKPSPASLSLAQRWMQLDRQVQSQLDRALLPAAAAGDGDQDGVDDGASPPELLPELLKEPAIARALSLSLPAGLPLMLASSSPVRDWESFAAADAPQRPVFGFRGASGIDGTLSLAAGLAISAGRLVLLTGDLALLHDANGWLWRQQLQAHGARLCVLVVDNGGGGIFEQLPIRVAGEPVLLDFERLFAMPQAIDHPALAAGYGVPSRRVRDLAALGPALAWGLQQPLALLELRSDRRADADWRRELRRRMAPLSALP